MMRRLLSVACALVLGATAASAQTRSPVTTINGAPLDLLRSGKYADAIRILAAVPRSNAAWLDAQKFLAIAYNTVGRYEDAERVARAGVAAQGGHEVANTLGEILMGRGKRAEAESVFVKAVAASATDSLTAKLNIAILHYDRGDREKALAEFDAFIDVYNNRLPSLTSAELVNVAVAVEYLGVKDAQLFKDALRALDRAIATDPDNIDAKVLIGELFLQKYNGEEAQNTFDEVLRLNPSLPRALVGAANRRSFDHQPGADSLIKEALKVNPLYVPAMLAVAAHFLDTEDYKSAQATIDSVLRVDPTSREALADAAIIKLMTADRAGYDQMRQRALALNPRDGDFFVAMGEASARIRLYAAAVDYAKQAIAVDSMNWSAYGMLGMNQLRIGRIDEGKQALDKAFAGDPYNIWVKNTLDLLDTFKNYDTVKTPHFTFMIDKAESGILGVYLGDLAEEAHKAFSTRYGYTPAPPVRMEIYRSHADFSVRTVGLGGGLPALGVSFGNTLAFDSPAAQDAGPFNWGSTMWHELAHTFTLGLTDNRVPRWFSEGLSVYEEHLARPGWGFGPTPGFIMAIKENKLVPVSRLNDGFMRPQYPEQIQYSYLQASYVCDLIVRDFGQQALVTMLQGYKAGQSTEQVFLNVTKADLKAFDKRFDDYLKQRFAGPIAAVRKIDSLAVDPSMSADEMAKKAAADAGNFGLQMIVGRILIERGEDSLAVTALERARALFPEYGGTDSPYPDLVKIYSKRAETAKVTALLTTMTRIGETNYDAHIALAALLETAGDFAGAADALDRAMYIKPFDVPIHVRMADLFEKAGNKAKTIRERRAVIALNPVDRADAYYKLAVAYEVAGDVPNAKKAVLRSLEEAPNFDKAQDLMLKLHGGVR
jgi:tetratricopeptide (TPR) repeat protein